MYDELVKRLRELHPEEFDGPWDFAFACQQAMNEASDAIEKLEAALILMVLQYCTDDDGTLWHMFMSAGERAFDALGITLGTNPQVLWDRLEKIEAKEKTTCEECQHECQMMGLDMEACSSYEPPKKLAGTDMRGGIRRDDAGNVIDWGITGPPGDVGKTEEE